MITLFMFKIIIGIVAFILFLSAQFIILRFFDKCLDINFKNAFNTIEQDAGAMATYYGMRYIGSSIALGIIVCVAFIV